MSVRALASSSNLPTAHISSADTAATPNNLLWMPGALGLLTICQDGGHAVGEGESVGVEVSIAGEIRGVAAEAWFPAHALASAANTAPSTPHISRTRLGFMASPTHYRVK